MPQPPILPLIDWRQVWAAGLDWNNWLDASETPAQRTELQGSYARFQPQASTVRRLTELRKAVHIIAIAEGWCGDVRRHVPVLQKLAEAGRSIAVRYVTRQQNLTVFARFLTNGGEAIPKAIFLSSDFVETGHWGPMPADGRRLLSQGKAANDITGARRLVKALYDADPERRAVESELLDHIDIAATVQIGTALATGTA